VVFGELDNFPLWVVDLGHCVDGFRWFLGSKAIFLYKWLIWVTVEMVLGVFLGVRQFSFMGGCFRALCRWF
jgi:hypothetical protein